MWIFLDGFAYSVQVALRFPSTSRGIHFISNTHTHMHSISSATMSYCPLCNKTNDNVRKQNKEQTFVGCQVYTSCVHFAQFADKYIRTQFLPAKLFRNFFFLLFFLEFCVDFFAIDCETNCNLSLCFLFSILIIIVMVGCCCALCCGRSNRECV